MSWKSIETAPKDGRPILAGAAKSGSMRVVISDGPLWVYGYSRGGGQLVFFPTHWMPLPEPPPFGETGV